MFVGLFFPRPCLIPMNYLYQPFRLQAFYPGQCHQQNTIEVNIAYANPTATMAKRSSAAHEIFLILLATKRSITAKVAAAMSVMLPARSAGDRLELRRS